MIPEQAKVHENTHCFLDEICTEDDESNRYSRLNGICNNLKFPSQGAAGTDFNYLVDKRKLKKEMPDY